MWADPPIGHYVRKIFYARHCIWNDSSLDISSSLETDKSTFQTPRDTWFQGKYAYLRDLAGLAVRNIESDMKTECEKPITQEIYHSFTEFKRKSRHAVLNALEDELRVCQFLSTQLHTHTHKRHDIAIFSVVTFVLRSFSGDFSKLNFRIRIRRKRPASALFAW